MYSVCSGYIFNHRRCHIKHDVFSMCSRNLFINHRPLHLVYFVSSWHNNQWHWSNVINVMLRYLYYTSAWEYMDRLGV